MNRLFLSAFIFLLQAPLPAQETVPDKPGPKNEAGINLLSIQDPSNKAGRPWITLNAVPGLYYKHYWGKQALRVSFDYLQNNFNQATLSGSDPDEPNYKEHVMKQEQVKIGYQRAVIDGRLKFFVFADLACNIVQDKGYLSLGYFIPPNPLVTGATYGYSMYYNANLNKLEFGAAAGAGLRYALTSRLALSYELSLGYARGFVLKQSGSGYGTGLVFKPVKQLGLAFLF